MATSGICTVPGCSKPAHTQQLCTGHYARLRKHGDPQGGRTLNGVAREYFETTVMNYRGDECPIWPGRRINGYGSMSLNGKDVIVSRQVCERLYGPPPSPDHQAAHSCGKGKGGCVAPHHLRWATRKENDQDKLIHGTRLFGQRNPLAKLTDEEARQIIALKGVMRTVEIAAKFGVSRHMVTRIQAGTARSWMAAE